MSDHMCVCVCGGLQVPDTVIHVQPSYGAIVPCPGGYDLGPGDAEIAFLLLCLCVAHEYI